MGLHGRAEQMTTGEAHAERTVNAHGGMTGTTPEQSRESKAPTQDGMIDSIKSSGQI